MFLNTSSAVCGARATSEIAGEAKRSICLQRRGSDFLTGGEGKYLLK